VSKRLGVIEACTHKDGNDAGLAVLISIKGTAQLNAEAVLGGCKVAANEQKNQLRFFELLNDSLVSVIPGGDLPTVPRSDYPIGLKEP
jgi:hypothetical protein